MLVDVGITHPLGHVEGRKPSYRLERGGVTTELPGVRWADWDRRRRLLVATDQGALEIRDGVTGAVRWSHPLTGLTPTPAPAPPRMRAW